jgi:hypothetical protein
LKQPNWCPHLGMCWFCHIRRNRRKACEGHPLWDQELDN